MLICGIDEAGRGCVAGGLFICGVILDSKHLDNLKALGVKDSKKLSYANRNILYYKIIDFIESNAGYYHILESSPNDIDKYGLKLCLKNSLQKLKDFAIAKNAKKITFDGNTNFGVKGISTLVKGDSKDVLIAAASILAKYSKDAQMLTLHTLYPQYDFKNNKGYLTKAHTDSIKANGLSPIHRKSFLIKELESNLF